MVSPVLGFVIPFKSKQKSKNWSKDCAFLERTLGSVINQKDDGFRCYVVCSDLPDTPMHHEKIEWIVYPFPFLESHEIEDEERSAVQYGLGSFLPAFYDQGKKILYGAKQARTRGCRYIMSLDADDLVSDRLVAHVRSAGGNEAGWFVNKGFMYPEGASYMIKVLKNMNYVCGSVNIVRSDLVPEPDFSSKRYQDFQFYSSHAYVVEFLQLTRNILLQPLPFYGIVYVIHQTNFFINKRQLTSFNVRNLAKQILRGKRLTKKARAEFNLKPVIA